MSRRGNYSVFLAISLTVLLGFAALAVDLAYARMVKTELQNAADSITHGAALALDGTEDGVALAYAVIEQLSAANAAGGKTLQIGDGATGSVLLGVWDDEFGAFSASEDPEEINAVVMRISLSGVGGWLLGGEGEVVSVSSTSARLPGEGAGAVDCFLPITIASCLIEDLYGEEGLQDIDFAFSPAGTDNIGWVSPFSNPSASWLRDQLGDCEYSGEIAIDDLLFLNNGVKASVLQDIASDIEASGTDWDDEIWGPMPEQYSGSGISPSKYGRTLEGPIAIIDDDSYCDAGGGSWTGTAPIGGFVWGAIFDVRYTGKASEKNLRIRIDTTTQRELGTDGGGPDYGISTSNRHALVR